jgi:hypothetical protein
MLPPTGPHPSALLPRFPPQPDRTRSMHGLRARPPPLTAQLSCGVLRTRAAPLMRLHSVPLAWPSCSRVYSRLPSAASLDWLCALHASLGSVHLCIAPVLIRARADLRSVAIPACMPNHHRSRADRPCSSRLASPRPFPLSCLCVVSALVPHVLMRCARVARPLGRAPIRVLAHAGFTLERRPSAMCRPPGSCAQAARLPHAPRHQRVLAPSPPATALGLFASLPSHAHCVLSSPV